MNPFDIVILAVIALSVVYALYRGSVQTVLNVGALAVAILITGSASSKLAERLRGNTAVTSVLTTYTDAVARVGDYDLASLRVAGITEETVDRVMEGAALPSALSNVLRRNLLAGAAVESDATVNDYVSGAIIASAIDVLCYLVLCLLIYAVLSVLISLIGHVFEYPILRVLDWVPAALFGVVRGVMLTGLIFLTVPLMATVIPLSAFQEALAESALAARFSSDAFFAFVLTGRIL
ncbi:MAG: CvpA family protein [Clostridia bacterium]|nr:CvpA family protein [Clostridia bacterium]